MRLVPLLALLLALPACDAAAFWETDERVPLRVDIQSQFADDRVRVEVGGVPVFDSRVTTEPLLGVAQIVETEVPPGRTPITVTVNGEAPTVVELDPADPAALAVGFDGETVSVRALDTLPLYD